MKLKRTLKTLAVATAGGAVAAYLLDPATGRIRRERIVRRVEQRSADVRDLVSKAARARDAVVSDAAEPQPADVASVVVDVDGVREPNADDPAADAS